MTTRFPCPYLHGEVELTDEREQHIAQDHPDLLPEYRDRVAATLADPDRITGSGRFGNTRLFSRWYDDLRGGKHVIVVVVSDGLPTLRHWIVTAHIARKLTQGEIQWARS